MMLLTCQNETDENISINCNGSGRLCAKRGLAHRENIDRRDESGCRNATQNSRLQVAKGVSAWGEGWIAVLQLVVTLQSLGHPVSLDLSADGCRIHFEMNRWFFALQHFRIAS